MRKLQNGIPPIPTREEICKAREIFREKEPCELFYRVATEMMSLAMQPPPSQPQPLFSETEALTVLLQTWNKRYYNKKRFDSKHLSELEQAVTANKPALISFRARSIATFSDNDKATIQKNFESFDAVIGPVGTGKSLHLFAPDFFPIWDSIIAKRYGLFLMYGEKHEKHEFNARKYIEFMATTKKQYGALVHEKIGDNLLKRIDEYNYCKFSNNDFANSTTPRKAR